MELFSEIHLLKPLWLSIIPTSLILLYYLHFIKNKKLNPITNWMDSISRDIFRHPVVASLNTLQSASGSSKKYSHFLRILNYIFFLSLISLSLSQPYRVGEKLPEPPEHRDIVFIVDTSVSMVLRDYLVNGERVQRITMLKDVLNHFVNQLQGNRIQIIAYSEQVYTLVPLTTDYDLINYQLRRLEPAILTGRTSDLSKALLYAVQDYKSYAADAEAKPVFVMLTDADRPVRNIDPRVAAEYVAQHDIRLHTVAIGAASYEAEDKQTTTLVYHPTSFYLLEQIATLGNGKFFWARDHKSLQQTLIAINEAEKKKAQTEPEYIQHPLYFWPLLVILSWFVLLHLYSILWGQRWTS